MSVCKFDTFENESEMKQMIEKSRGRTIEFLKMTDPWDIIDTKQKELCSTT